MTAEETWLERVVAWRKSVLSAAAFCEGKPFDATSLRGWSSRLGRAGKVSRSPRGRRPKSAPARSSVTFARVVTTPNPAPRRTATFATASGGVLVVAIGPMRIEVAPGFDPLLLRSVVAALAGGPT